jgi:ferric-dicitrate binding protein FerR (iron transport regulator)
MKHAFAVFALVALLATPLAVRASDAKAKAAGTVISVSGKVTVITAKAGDAGSSLKPGQAVFAGDRIKTGANGKLQIVLSDGTQLKVNYLTDITLRDTDVKGKASERGIASIKIALGNLWAKVTKKNSRLEFETPAAVAAVKGTEPDFTVDELGDLCVKLKEGKLDLSNDLGGVSMTELQQLCVKKGEKPGKPQAWDGKGLGSDSGPSSAVVTLHVKDKDGKTSEVKVQYDKKP